MADITNKAEEFAGRAKEAAGDLVGNDDLKADGAADKATAQVKQGLDAVADKAEDAAQAVAEKAEDAKEAVTEKADSRVAIAVVAGLAVVALLVVRRNRGKSRRQKHPVAKKVVAAGVTRALTH
ncbi:CsbD family protein [Mycolicibacterium sp. A43C]